MRVIMTIQATRISVFFITFAVLFLLYTMEITPDPIQEEKKITRESGVITVNASGEGDYSRIQWAIDNASDGDIVFIKAGIYLENIIVDNSISLIGSGKDNTIICGESGASVVKITTDRVNVTGFQITSSSPGHDPGIYLCSSNNCIINANNCSNNEIGIQMIQSSNNIIANNTCNSNNDGIYLFESDNNHLDKNICNSNWVNGISLYSSSSNTIMRNTCFSNSNGIELNREFSEKDSCFNKVINNTCNSNHYSGIHVDGSVVH